MKMRYMPIYIRKELENVRGKCNETGSKAREMKKRRWMVRVRWGCRHRQAKTEKKKEGVDAEVRASLV